MKAQELDLEFPDRAIDIFSKIFGGADCVPNLASCIEDRDESGQAYSETNAFHDAP
jgi:hypothetical protein